MPETELLTKQEIAARVRASTRTIDNWRKKLGMPHRKVGHLIRFSLAEVLDWLKKNFGR
jgi:excisionase family DNA binding protein